MRSGRSSPASKPPKKSVCIIEDQRPIEKRFAGLKDAGNRETAIRTLIMVELGNMSAEDARHVLKHINSKYVGNEHPIFCIPVRNGIAKTDVLFEDQITPLVKEHFEVRDGEIVLKGGATPVDVRRIWL